jgi:16S rRNA (guanine527-N7)-methyltransferase
VTDIARRLRASAAEALRRPLGADEEASLYKYLNLLVKWQKSQRLIGSDDPGWIIENVIADSLLFTRVLSPGIRRLCDVGSGAGIPGIPLKVVMPSVAVTLLEPRQRRASFLAAAIRQLSLTDCRVVVSRVEDAPSEFAGSFDAIVMRCAGNPTEFIGSISPWLTPRGIIVASGPPAPYPVPKGEWVEVHRPRGPRRFWVYCAG